MARLSLGTSWLQIATPPLDDAMAGKRTSRLEAKTLLRFRIASSFELNLLSKRFVAERKIGNLFAGKLLRDVPCKFALVGFIVSLGGKFGGAKNRIHS